MIKLNVADIPAKANELKAGDAVLLSGEIICARDAAHKRFFELLDAGKDLPFDPKGAVIYYAGPTPAKPGTVIGSCGPTTSARMDAFTPRMLDLGVCATVGKGKRSDEVLEAMKRNGAPYFCAVGGAGALASKCIVKSEVIAFEELGCEAVRRMTFENFPLIVGIDAAGNSVLK